jgi:hypothetical protein
VKYPYFQNEAPDGVKSRVLFSANRELKPPAMTVSASKQHPSRQIMNFSGAQNFSDLFPEMPSAPGF